MSTNRLTEQTHGLRNHALKDNAAKTHNQIHNITSITSKIQTLRRFRVHGMDEG